MEVMTMMMKVDGALQKEMDERNLRPRLCYLTKGDRGYGFHLHGERGSGAQFIRRIEAGSPAELAGLRSGDRVVEVNGENVENESHHQVVEKIMEVENRTRLLVVDRETDEFLLLHSLPCTEDLAVEMSCLISPRASSSSLASSTLSFTSSFRDSLTPSPSDSIVLSPRDTITSLMLPQSTSSSPPDSINPLPKDSIIPSPQISTPSPGDSINQAPYEAITQSPSNSITQSPTNPKIQSPFDSITHSPSDSITTPFIREKSDDTHGMEDTGNTNNQKSSGKEDMVMRDLRPRLCYIVKDEQGFGFNLHCDKRRVGQFIRSVDPDSPAQRAGLHPGDRLVQVNGRSIEGLRHSEVVKIIRGGGRQTRLLVVDQETDELFDKLGITPTTAHLNEDCVDGPIVQSPTSTCPVKDSSESPSVIRSDSLGQPPIKTLAETDPPIRNESLKQQNHGRCVSSRSIASDTSMELSSSDTSNMITDMVQGECTSAPAVQEVKLVKNLDPLWASGLNLSPTAAEARQKVILKKGNKRAPPMAWNKKYEIFCNF
ncbi:Na(+)/H(+) exchange regulatory cofactor NHE-RF2 [Tachysurus fulvidraco]|uniref:Na(+)/H(+) exchange regulatory cofactor NHE-RF2 n=1 Tax=Tachysurus fulvidraco TaxID=1234273 RepID=UPI001FEE6902|nr:Na(+)/H(+) exchange regulatory cofactor NHE-RF2 [Tachysurus fulvidraco]